MKGTKDWFATWIGGEFFLIWTKPIFQIIWLTICVAGYLRYSNQRERALRDSSLFKVKVETDEDYEKFWDGYFRYPNSTEYVDVRKAIDIPSDMGERGISSAGANWSYCQKYLPAKDCWKLAPWMRELHDAFMRTYRHPIWEEERYKDLNKLNNLKKCAGFDGDGEFNWMINGYIVIGENKYGYVGLGNVIKALEASNGKDFLNSQEVRQLNKLDDPFDIPALKEGMAVARCLDNESRLRNAVSRYDNIVGFNCYCDGDNYFYHQKPAYPMNMYGFIQVDEDKYVPVGLEEAYEYFESVNGYPIYLTPCGGHNRLEAERNRFSVPMIRQYGQGEILLNWGDKEYLTRLMIRYMSDDYLSYDFILEKLVETNLSDLELYWVLNGKMVIEWNKKAARSFLERETKKTGDNYYTNRRIKEMVDSLSYGAAYKVVSGADPDKTKDDCIYYKVWRLFKEVNGYEVWESSRVIEGTKKESVNLLWNYRSPNKMEKAMKRDSCVYLYGYKDDEPFRKKIYVHPSNLGDYFEKYIFEQYF